MLDEFLKPIEIGVLTVHVVKAKNLASFDSNGLSDPFVVLEMGQKKQQTDVAWKSLNPVWNKTFHFDLHSEGGMLNIMLIDKDTFSYSDFMGGFQLSLKQIESFHGEHQFEISSGGTLTLRFEVESSTVNRTIGCYLSAYREYYEDPSYLNGLYVPKSLETTGLTSAALRFFTIATPYIKLLKILLIILKWKYPALSAISLFAVWFAICYPKIAFLGLYAAPMLIMTYTYHTKRISKPEYAKLSYAQGKSEADKITTKEDIKEAVDEVLHETDSDFLHVTQSYDLGGNQTNITSKPVPEPDRRWFSSFRSQKVSLENGNSDNINITHNPVSFEVEVLPEFNIEKNRRNSSSNVSAASASSMPASPGARSRVKTYSTPPRTPPNNNPPTRNRAKSNAAPPLASEASSATSLTVAPSCNVKPLSSPTVVKKKRDATTSRSFEDCLNSLTDVNYGNMDVVTGKWYRNALTMAHGLLIFLIEGIESLEKIINWEDYEWSVHYFKLCVVLWIGALIVPISWSFIALTGYIFSLNTTVHAAIAIFLNGTRYLTYFLSAKRKKYLLLKMRKIKKD